LFHARETARDTIAVSAAALTAVNKSELRLQISHTSSNALTGHLFAGGGGFLPSLLSLFFTFAAFPFSRHKVASQIQLRDLGSAVSSPRRESDICSHQTHSMGSKYTKNAAFLCI